MSPAEAPALRDALERGRATREPRRYQTVDGVAVQVVPLGAPGGALVIRADVGEQARRERRLRDVEACWRSITENSADTVIVIDGDDRIRSINRTIPPSTPESVIGTSIYRYQFEDDHALIRGALHHARTTGQPTSYETKLDVRALGIDGPQRWYVTKVVPLASDESGQGIILIASDITERKTIERELGAIEERWRSLTVNSDDTIQVVDRDGIIRYINKALPPLTVDQVIGTPIYHWVVPDDAAMIQATLERVFETAITDSYETRLDMSAFGLPGEALWYSVKVVPTTVEGEVSGAILIASNVTKAKRVEEQLRSAKELAEAASSAKSTFLANMSHEVRTPLNAIIGLTNLALRADGGPKVMDYLRKVRASSRSLLGIINDILDFSRIEAGKIVLEHEDFDLRDVLEGLGDLVGHEAHRKGIEFLVSIGPGVPTAVRGDALRLNQVLTNLAHNAVKFTNEGTIVVRAVCEEDGPRPRYAFSVTDTGIGIAPEELPRIFESFTQLDGSTTRAHGGAGLGLAICERLVAVMGGRLEVASAPGRGSTFSFVIELERQPREQAAHAVPARRRGTRVLVVDDNPLSAEILAEMLAAFGLRVATASSGVEAVRAVRAARDTDPYALVVLDWNMPVMDGLETARRIEFDGDRVPKVILSTAYDYSRLRSLADDDGIDEVLPKPVTESALFDAVMRALGELDASPRLGDGSLGVITGEATLLGMRVLVVEDVDVNQQLVREILDDAGALVRLASDGREAVAAVYEEPFDVVLMDLQMPGMDGFEAARTIRSDPAFARLPIIALTAHAMRGDRERCLDAGMNDHVSKPIHAGALLATIAAHVRPDATPRPIAEQGSGGMVRNPARGTGGWSLPGVDVGDALGHYGGNIHTYRALLDGFLRQYGGAPAAIRAALDEGDTARARELVHAVVGTAGNLRLSRVYARTLELQALLRRDALAELPRALDALAAALTEAERSIASLPAAEEAAPPSPAARATPSMRARARVRLDELDALLARNSLDARAVFDELRVALAGGAVDDVLAGIAGAIQRLDFATARDGVARLRALGVAGERGTP